MPIEPENSFLHRFSRRKFIRYSAALSGGMMVFPMLGQQATANASVPDQELFWYQKPLRITHTVLRETDARNYDAREYIIKHIESPPSLSQLSKIAGINEYKLKRGFKEMFNNTVFGYLAEARLELAKHDLLESNKKIIEIASDLGYSSVQHFSNAFKKKFGFSPNSLRK